MYSPILRDVFIFKIEYLFACFALDWLPDLTIRMFGFIMFFWQYSLFDYSHLHNSPWWWFILVAIFRTSHYLFQSSLLCIFHIFLKYREASVCFPFVGLTCLYFGQSCWYLENCTQISSAIPTVWAWFGNGCHSVHNIYRVTLIPKTSKRYWRPMKLRQFPTPVSIRVLNWKSQGQRINCSSWTCGLSRRLKYIDL